MVPHTTVVLEDLLIINDGDSSLWLSISVAQLPHLAFRCIYMTFFEQLYGTRSEDRNEVMTLIDFLF